MHLNLIPHQDEHRRAVSESCLHDPWRSTQSRRYHQREVKDLRRMVLMPSCLLLAFQTSNRRRQQHPTALGGPTGGSCKVVCEGFFKGVWLTIKGRLGFPQRKEQGNSDGRLHRHFEWARSFLAWECHHEKLQSLVKAMLFNKHLQNTTFLQLILYPIKCDYI